MENENGTNLRGEELEQWFKERLKEGAWGEKQVAKHLIEKGWKITEISEGKFKEWDIKATIKDQEKTFEVKANYYEYKKFRHPMVVIETESNGVLSGLSTTTADYYILYYPFEDFFFIERTEDIKAMIASGKYEKVKGGRKDMATMYQIPRDHFVNKRPLKFMDHLDTDTKQQEWFDWYCYKYINNGFNLL
jgi:hypothetical protein